MILIAYILVALNAAICGLLFFRKSRQGSPFQFFYLSLLSLVILPGLWDINSGYYTFHPFAPPINLTADLIISVHLKVLMMMVAFLVFEEIASLRMGAPSIHFSSTRVEWSTYDLIAIWTIVSAVAGIWYYGFNVLSSTSFSEIRAGRIGAFPLYMFYLQMILIGIPGFYIIKFGRPVAGLVVFLIFVSMYLFLGGSRQAVVISIAIALGIVLGRSGRWNAIILLAIFTIGFAAMDLVLQLLKALRNLPSLDQRLSFIAALLSGEQSLSLLGRELGSEENIRYVMYDFLYYDPPNDFGTLSYFRRTLLFWLPSSLDVLNIKPPDFEAIMFAEAMGNRVGTMHATFFGSAFADAGFFSFVWVALFVSVFKSIELIMMRLEPVERGALWGSSVYVAFMVARGSLYAPLIIVSIAISIAVISSKLRRRTSNGLSCA